MYKKSYQISIFFLFLITLCVSASAKTSTDGVWQETDDTSFRQRTLERLVLPASYKTFRINQTVMRSILADAPMEFTDEARNNQLILTFPMPDGSFQRFRITESPIVEPGLLVKFPELRTYSGQGVDDPSSTVRFDFLPSGFHSQILSSKGTILVDPYFKSGDTENYISYVKNTVSQTDAFICHFNESKEFQSFLKIKETLPFGENTNDVISGTTLRTYRLALAATGEYTAAAGGGTVAGGLAAQVLIMNRVNGVYEKDVAIRMVIIANNNLLIYTNGASDPYTNNDGGTMLSENISNIDTVIGTANYDIGHVFSTGGGGVAFLAVPCGASKAGGVTGLPNPVGDPFAIDYVAHEMGHQWSANHTFNTTVGSCGGGNRSNANSFEPGSGITIMAYAGICGSQNLAANSIDTFHVRSLEVIVNFSQNGTGNTCDVETATGNTPPTVTVPLGNSFNIPRQTPFSLTASATDVNGDTLTYDWQQYNAGGTAGPATVIPNADADGIARPLFRPYLPSSSPTRFFPSLQFIRNNANVPPNTTGGFMTGELMSAITRTMNFQVVVRDNRVNGGGINSATVAVIVDAASGPFNVTAPNTGISWTGGSIQTVTWNVANTTAAPVSAANVKISFSTDGGLTFPTTVLASTPNDGTQTITVPNVATTQGRIKVEGENNIFFDMSDANFTIVPGVVTIQSRSDFDGDGRTDLSVYRPSEGNWYLNRSTAGFQVLNFGISTDTLVPGDFDGDGKADTAVFRANANPAISDFLVLNSNGFTVSGASWGVPGDVAMTGNYDGDARADFAVFRPSNSTWYILNSSNGSNTIEPFGTTGDTPLAMDNNADGKTNLAVFRPSNNTWYIAKPTGTPATNFDAYPFGLAGDLLVPADYDNDNRDDVAVFRPSNGTWYILRSTNGVTQFSAFGTSGDVPVPGDYDGDGADDLAVYRSGTWYVNRSTSGLLIQGFGLATDRAIPKQYIP